MSHSVRHLIRGQREIRKSARIEARRLPGVDILQVRPLSGNDVTELIELELAITCIAQRTVSLR